MCFEFRLINYAADLIRHYVQFGYWPLHNNRPIIVRRSVLSDLLWLMSRT